ncbi:aspartyl-tRNA(Asn)/glutamyl-tRNA(Gln) amidotransferase subunit A [Stella humosa]|uniref:Aspartyl-tRNA(Asn)/glutamyl-tRNA(Gln) amidotransferase subunit A n=1 Tax=Stella humosa TaxID=94 RepID=A0A3N1KN40_9PROT|nr:amidase family protein [Stella humosa]ROP83143.1 aspartyl-tRNA(Asn)/glutamyl-tRNA(Gln) amidotransferase subunit A [Stella humosa]
MTLDLAQYRRMTAAALVAAYRSRDLSPREVAEAALHAIEESNPALNAVTHVDAEGARAQAAASEGRWRAGTPNGPLDGVPTLMKDGLWMKGIPVYRGTMALDRHAVVPDTDSPPVARLREDGAILLGKTTMCDLGMFGSGYSSKFGPTRNPADLSRTSGGSSSGSAAAVAAGIIPFAVGTDIVGSIRQPASFCGLVGLKPSYGRVPTYPNSSPAAVAGPLARTVEDAALLLDTIARPDFRDFACLGTDTQPWAPVMGGSVAGTRIGYLRSVGFGLAPDPAVAAAVAEGVRRLAGLGCEVTEITSPFQQGDEKPGEDFYRMRPYSELAVLSAADRATATVIDAWSAPAGGYSGVDYHRLFLATQGLRERTLGMIRDFDFLVLPTSPIPPFAAELPGPEGHSTFTAWSNTFLFNLTEQPGLSINCGFTADGLPIGLQIVGHRFDDRGVLRMGAAFERAMAG